MVKSFGINTWQDHPTDLTFSADGTKMFIIGTKSGGTIQEFTLTTAFDIYTSSYVTEYNISAQDYHGQILPH